MLADWSVLLLRVVGVGLIGAGVAHAWLPRALGWTVATHRQAGALSALVIKLHVWFVGLFLIMIGTVSVAGAAELVGGGDDRVPGVLGPTFLWGAAVIFVLRWATEIVLVPRALAVSRPVWRVLHRAALVVWPSVAAVFVLAAVVG